MYWKQNCFDYDILIPPINKPFEQFSINEADSFFKWYLENIPARVKYLEKISNCELNKSFDSLVPLWKWFLKHAKIENTTEAQKAYLKKELANNSKQYCDDFILYENEQFSLVTEYMMRDIGMYVGQVFTEFSTKIKWTYHTDVDKDSFANIPLLDGFVDSDFSPPFPMQFEPVHMIHVIAANLFDNSQNKDDLYNLCTQWSRMIL